VTKIDEQQTDKVKKLWRDLPHLVGSNSRQANTGSANPSNKYVTLNSSRERLEKQR
jgi:hypothetical protein